jgi:hypothetical protein
MINQVKQLKARKIPTFSPDGTFADSFAVVDSWKKQRERAITKAVADYNAASLILQTPNLGTKIKSTYSTPQKLADHVMHMVHTNNPHLMKLERDVFKREQMEANLKKQQKMQYEKERREKKQEKADDAAVLASAASASAASANAANEGGKKRSRKYSKSSKSKSRKNRKTRSRK